jgi:hypothetical protein
MTVALKLMAVPCSNPLARRDDVFSRFSDSIPDLFLTIAGIRDYANTRVEFTRRADSLTNAANLLPRLCAFASRRPER